jgi:multicomponent Na+:H+ antiporter subunit E
VSPSSIAPPGVRQLPLIGWLVLVWILLWGTWSWANLLSGIVVALFVTLLLPLPPVTEHARFRPLRVLWFMLTFLRDLAVSSVEVAWAAARPGGPIRSAIVVVDLRTDSDLLITLITETLNLTPGSLVLDIDRENRRILLHVLPVRTEADVDQRRADVQRVEESVVRAFGSSQEIAGLAEPFAMRPSRTRRSG